MTDELLTALQDAELGERLTWYARNKERTVFGLLPDTVSQGLFEATHLVDVAPGREIERTEDELSVVYAGRVELLTRERFGGAERSHGFVTEGRSIELASFLRGESPSYIWRTDGRATILRLPRRALDDAFEQDPSLELYLHRVTLHREVRRLKNDLRLLGLDQEGLIRVLSRLKRIPGDRLTRLKDHDAIALLHSGQVRLATEGSSRVFLEGDLFTLRDDHDIECVDDTEVWLLDRQVLEKEDPIRAQEWWRLLHTLANPVAEVEGFDRPSDDSPSYYDDLEDEDDGLEIDDFMFAEGENAPKAKKPRAYPVKIQHDEMDCGAACMTMLAAYHGRKISLPVFRSLVHVTRDGASMLSIKKAAERVGFESIGVFSGFKYLSQFKGPFIALMEYHFVVVYHVDEKRVIVGDPAGGVKELTAEEFEEDFSQNVLLFRRTDRVDAYPESEASFRKYWELFKDSVPALAEISIASLVLLAFGLLTPFFTQLIFDRIMSDGDRQLLTALMLGVVTLYFFSGVMEWLRGYLLADLTSRLDAKFNALFMRQTFKLPLSFFSVRRVGDITTRVGEIQTIRSFFTDESVALLINVATALLYLLVLGLYNWKLFVVFVLVAPLMSVALFALMRRIVEMYRTSFKAMGKSQSKTFEHFDSFETLKFLNAEVPARWRWTESLYEVLNLERRLANVNAFVSAFSSSVKGLISTGMLLVAILLYLRGELSLGQVVAVNMLVVAIIGPISSLISSTQYLNEVAVSLARVDDIMTSSVEPSGRSLDSIDAEQDLRGDIVFENVGFRYGSELSPMVLTDINLHIRPGETVAFVGPSGCGKTTLAHMVNLLYRPVEGKIFVDGTDARELPLSYLRSQVAMVVQDSELFSGTIIDNISLGDASPSFSKVLSAARAAAAHDFIAKLPKGYGSVLGERGAGLSGGQKQRLNIARALYRDPSILVMDEATAALDAVSEDAIVSNLKRRADKKTTILIAHRLNTVMHADRIAVMDRGRIAELGTHDVLLNKGGLYAELFRKQLNL